MCGILFSVINNSEVLKNFDKLKHRGPDNSSYKIINNKFLGTHRLSIINQSETGNQPLELNGVYLICNGQIYNYIELANKFDINIIRSDVDIILHLYDNFINNIYELINLLDGDFAFVIYDSNLDILHISRDIVGVRPLFYSKNIIDGSIICVSSEIKGLQNIKQEENKTINENEVNLLNNLDTENNRNAMEVSLYFPEFTKENINSSLFFQEHNEENINYSTIIDENNDKFIEFSGEYQNENIFVFTPGKLITYNFKNNITNECNYIEACQEKNIVNLLKKAVIKRIENSERPVAFLCSGGLDSSIILCIAYEYLKSQNKDLYVYTIKYVDKNGNSNSEDDFYCTKLIELLDVKFTSFTYNFEDVKEYIDTVIYQTETYDPNTVRTSIANYLLAKKISETTNNKVFLSGEGADELFCGYLYFNQIKDGSEINKESNRLIQNIHMFDILKADRCFSAFGLEVRVPFLDKEFITYIKSIDGTFKSFNNSIEKNLLRVAFKKEYPELSKAKIIDRPKERFSDGVSFNYVPDLLNYFSNYESSVLNIKEEAEKKYYKTIFEKYYPNLEHVIINRTLPTWCLNLKEVVDFDNNPIEKVKSLSELINNIEDEKIVSYSYNDILNEYRK